MIKHIIIVGGEPATGKTTLVRPFAQGMKIEAYGKPIGTMNWRHRLLVLGVYDEQTFSGTDRLAMNIQPTACKALEKLDSLKEKFTVLFEGDRLLNGKMIEYITRQKWNLTLLIIEVSEAELDRRHGIRNDSQKATFLKGRKTKIRNIIDAYKSARELRIIVESNETRTDQLRLKAIIRSLILGNYEE